MYLSKPIDVIPHVSKMEKECNWADSALGSTVIASRIDNSGLAHRQVCKFVKVTEDQWINLGASLDRDTFSNNEMHILYQVLQYSHQWGLLEIVTPPATKRCAKNNDLEKDLEDGREARIEEKSTGTFVDRHGNQANYEIYPVVVQNVSFGNNNLGLRIRFPKDEQDATHEVIVTVIDCVLYIYSIVSYNDAKPELIETNIVPVMAIKERNSLVSESKQKTLYEEVCVRLGTAIIPHIKDMSGDDCILPGKIVSDPLYGMFEHLVQESLWMAGGTCGLSIDNTEYVFAGNIFYVYASDVEYDDSRLSSYRTVIHALSTPMVYRLQDDSDLINYEVSQIVMIAVQNQDVTIVNVK